MELRISTLLFGLYPINALFGFVAYSESIFLFFTISSWYFYQKKQYSLSGLLASLAVLTRYYAVLIPIIYFIIEFMKRRGIDRVVFEDGKLLLYLFPLVAMLINVLISASVTGDVLSFWNARNPWGTSLANPLEQFRSIMGTKFVPADNTILNAINRYLYLLPMAFLSLYLYRMDKKLFIYSMFFLALISSIGGRTALSVHRYTLSLWPAFLIFGKIRDILALLPIAALFFVMFLYSTLLYMTSFYA